MPSSRGRRNRNQSVADQRRRRQQRDRAARQSSGRAQAYDPDDRVTIGRAIDVEARGDPAAALDLHLTGPHLEGTMREHLLRELVLLGDDAPPWVHSRWVLRQTQRWMLFENHELMRHAMRHTVAVAYPGIDPERPQGTDPRTFVLQVLSSDWVCAQLALFDHGGIGCFLAEKAGAGLVARTERLADWGSARMGGYCLDDVVDDRILITDLETDQQREVLNLGATWGREAGSHVIGRLVPITTGPGLMFESRPLTVDFRTAWEVAMDTDVVGGWLEVLGDARAEGRLGAGFSIMQPTSLLCDLESGAPAGLDDVGAGSPAEGAVALATTVLDLVADLAMASAHLAALLSAVLLDPASYDALSVHCTQRRRRPSWESLARALQPPLRDRCLELARRSGGAEGDSEDQHVA